MKNIKVDISPKTCYQFKLLATYYTWFRVIVSNDFSNLLQAFELNRRLLQVCVNQLKPSQVHRFMQMWVSPAQHGRFTNVKKTRKALNKTFSSNLAMDLVGFRAISNIWVVKRTANMITCNCLDQALHQLKLLAVSKRAPQNVALDKWWFYSAFNSYAMFCVWCTV